MKKIFPRAKKLPDIEQIDNEQHWIVCASSQSSLNSLPYGEALCRKRTQLGREKTDSTPLEIDLANNQSTHVVFACVKAEQSAFELLTLARKLVSAQIKQKVVSLNIIVHGFKLIEAERIAEAVIAAACAASAKMPSYKSDKPDETSLSSLQLYGVRSRHGFRRTFCEANGNALARSLSMLPPNYLTPGQYVKRVEKIAKQEKWKMDFYDTKILKKKKAGAFLAVTLASPVADAGIVRLRYTPKTSRTKKKTVLVGKGICYDTGGVNLKPAKFMFGMHEDMQGSAVALGTFLALTRMQVKFPIECWLALATNHIGSKAYKPNDVITASDGTTIEIVHTDAEGRMVLADTLALASAEKPRLIIDYATLTGACVYSLGSAYSGVFSNREKFHQSLIKAGQESGERVWPFPIDEDFDKGLDSDIADVKQCAIEGNADHILASRFLQRFVTEDTPWVHVDLAASNNKGGLAHVPTDTTGFGVRYTLNLLLNQKI